jgi:hypothetical protein
VFFYHSGMYESFPFAILTSRSTSYSEWEVTVIRFA